jgi:hypothetical protein
MTPKQAERVGELLDFCLDVEYRTYDSNSVVRSLVKYQKQMDTNYSVMRGLAKYKGKHRDKRKQSFFGGDSLFGATNDN